ncbi:MAG: hypothetical protein QXI19_10965, partial [Candidatus Caldarchaeum sp.]
EASSHDIRREIEELRKQMEAIQTRLKELEAKSRAIEGEKVAGETEFPVQPSRIGKRVQGFIQSLNPDISVVGTFAAAYFSVDEPLRRAEVDPENTGINLQEIELGMGAAVDPYLRGDLFLSFGRDEVEIEEAYATTLFSMPLSLQIRGGIMRSKFGRINTQHRHFQDFATLPLPVAYFLGEHLNPTSLEFNVLAPLPWFMELSASVGSPEVETPSFDRDENANDPSRLLYVFRLGNFFEISEALSLSIGGSFATGSNGTESGARTNLLGFDLYAKYRPLRDNPYSELSLQYEFMMRGSDTPEQNLDDFGAYAQILYRFAKRWKGGFRFDYVHTHDPIQKEGVALDEELPLGLLGTELRYAAVLTFTPTEFSKIRLQYEFADPDFMRSFSAIFLQFQYALGAHGAHPF